MLAADNILIQFILGNIGFGSNQVGKVGKVGTTISFRIKYFFRGKIYRKMWEKNTVISLVELHSLWAQKINN